MITVMVLFAAGAAGPAPLLLQIALLLALLQTTACFALPVALPRLLRFRRMADDLFACPIGAGEFRSAFQAVLNAALRYWMCQIAAFYSGWMGGAFMRGFSGRSPLLSFAMDAILYCLLGWILYAIISWTCEVLFWTTVRRGYPVLVVSFGGLAAVAHLISYVPGKTALAFGLFLVLLWPLPPTLPGLALWRRTGLLQTVRSRAGLD